MILLSAGHHPVKPGACYEGFCEHDEAVRWIEAIYNELGHEVALQVPPGVLREKIEFINVRQPELAVEVHFNSLRIWEDLNNNGVIDEGEMINKGQGALTLYYPGSVKGKALATMLQGAIEPLFSKHWRGVMKGYYRMDPKRGPDYFLARTRCPSVIIEPEFIHHRELLTDKRSEACSALANTLLKARTILEE